MNTLPFKLSYSITNETWYHRVLTQRGVIDGDHVAEIMVGVHDIDADLSQGGCRAEFGIRWYDLDSGHKPPTPRLEMFADSWPFLNQLQDLYYGLSQAGRYATVAAVVAILRNLGAVDTTMRTRD